MPVVKSPFTAILRERMFPNPPRTIQENTMELKLRLTAKTPDPCDPNDREFTQQEILTACSDLLDFVAEQAVFDMELVTFCGLQNLPISLPTES